MNPFKAIWFFVSGLVILTYLAFCEWLDARKSDTDAEAK
jgi:hypothetical protein